MMEMDRGETAALLAERIGKGGFLTVRDAEGRTNTMTIGWATIGTIWRRDVLMVLVRPERHTHSLLEGAEDFTVSIPAEGTMTEELRLCGSTSGRDMDKFSAHGLEAVEGRETRSPVIGGCELCVECRLLFRQTMEGGDPMEPGLRDWYDGEGWHTLYFGEVVARYSP